MKCVRSRILTAAMRLFAEQGGSQLSVSDLAREAGVSRGTIYNNVDDTDGLLLMICDELVREMPASIAAGLDVGADPATRLSGIIRLLIRRVQEDPDWGRFIARYSQTDPRLARFWANLPAEELRRGHATGLFEFELEQLPSITSTAGGATFGAMLLVLDGRKTWREAGSDTAEMILRALGVPRDEARRIAARDLADIPRIEFAAAA